MKNLSILSLTLALFSISSFPLPTSANITYAEECDSGRYEMPSSESRTFRDDRGFSFAIPANYRAMGLNNGIEVYEPAAFSFVQCIVQNNIPTDLPAASVTILFSTIRAPNASLYELVIQDSPYTESEGFNFRSSNLAGYPSLTYSEQYRLDNEILKYTSVILPDTQTLITIYGYENDEVLQRVLSTFEFE